MQTTYMWTTCSEYLIMLRTLIHFMYLFISCLEHACSTYKEKKYSCIFLCFINGIMFNIKTIES